jgi:hypothetical protein
MLEHGIIFLQDSIASRCVKLATSLNPSINKYSSVSDYLPHQWEKCFNLGGGYIE